MKWAKVVKGSTVLLKGQPWTVEKAKVKGKSVRVTVTGKAGTFTREVPAKGKVELVSPAERWATKREYRETMAELEARERANRPKPKAAKVGWNEPEDKAEKVIRKNLDAKLVAIEHEDGVYTMPPVDPSTIAAHLLAFHGIRHDGVPLAEAKAWMKLHGAEEAVKLASYEDMRRVHENDHREADAGMRSLHVNHVHDEKRPAS